MTYLCGYRVDDKLEIEEAPDSNTGYKRFPDVVFYVYLVSIAVSRVVVIVMCVQL